mmetsp:Transcript_18179/g.36808  ORF Transcript_18179/g.36808 Transcript_18179/m.36808 type:complete len:214 (-) Transcript_18179:121-762(-)
MRQMRCRLIPVFHRVADLLASLSSCLLHLLVLLQLLARQLLLLVHLDHVPKGVLDFGLVLVERVVLVHDLLVAACALALPPQPPGVAQPRLRAQRACELAVVTDHDHPAIVRADSGGEGAQRVAVEVVCGLVEHQNVRVLPHRRRQHHLHLLPARETPDAVVACKLRLEPHVSERLLHLFGGEGLARGAEAQGLALIHAVDELLEPKLHQLVP